MTTRSRITLGDGNRVVVDDELLMVCDGKRIGVILEIEAGPGKTVLTSFGKHTEWLDPDECHPVAETEECKRCQRARDLVWRAVEQRTTRERRQPCAGSS